MSHCTHITPGLGILKRSQSYPSFRDKIMPLGSTSGSSEENWENTESGLALADQTTAVLRAARYRREQWAGSPCFWIESGLQNHSVPSKLPQLHLPCCELSLISQPQPSNEPSLACRAHPVPGRLLLLPGGRQEFSKLFCLLLRMLLHNPSRGETERASHV